MIDVNQLRRGIAFLQGGEIYKVTEYSHHKPGRGKATIRVSVRNVRTGANLQLTFNSGDRVALMINGLGGTPISELYVLYRAAGMRCKDAGFEIVRNYVGEYCTSLEMAGASLTLLRLDDELEKLLAAPAEIPIRVF